MINRLRGINQMPVVKHEDVKPHYTSEELLDKIAIAVNGLRDKDIGMSQDQRLLYEMLYSLAIALKDKL
jgi:hypothetical protein